MWKKMPLWQTLNNKEKIWNRLIEECRRRRWLVFARKSHNIDLSLIEKNCSKYSNWTWHCEKKPWTLTGHCLIEVLRVCLILIVTSFATCVIVEAKNSIILIRTILSKELQWVLNDFQWVIFSVFQEFFDYVVSSSWSFFLGANQACNSCLS